MNLISELALAWQRLAVKQFSRVPVLILYHYSRFTPTVILRVSLCTFCVPLFWT